MKPTRLMFAAVAAAVLAACAGNPDAPAGETFAAQLAPSAGVTSSGTGMGEFTLDPATKALSYTVTYSGTTGPGMAAHIHGPADPGGNAPPVVPFATATSPITGTATLTDAQIADLRAGRWYVNIHTAAHRGGEIRGQITAK